MENLKALVDLISKNKLKQTDVLKRKGEPATHIETLYEGIASGKFQDEEATAAFFFGESPYRKSYFARLKRQLKDRLINNLFLVDVNQPSYTEINKAYITCYRDVAAAKILLTKYLRRPAVELFERSLRKALQFEFTELTLSCAKDLRHHYGSIMGDRKKFKYYNDLCDKYAKILIAELKVEEYFSEISSNFTYSQGFNREVLEKASAYCGEIRDILRKYHSYRLNLHSYMLLSMRYEMACDYQNVIEICKEALDFFETKKHLGTSSATALFMLKQLAAYTYLREYRKAEESALTCLDMLPEGSNNWFMALDYYMIVCFHSRQFQKAYDIYQKAIHHQNFKYQYQNISEHWRIHEAFIFYFIHLKRIEPCADSQLKKFRVSKFLNEVPSFSKDKRGINITILILQILFLLQQGRYSEIIDRMEPLKTYNHRYLRKDDTFRSNCFLKMLLQLPQNGFHKAAVLRKADKYWQKLISVPLEMSSQSIDLEIVPYEMLWQYIIESLDTKRYG